MEYSGLLVSGFLRGDTWSLPSSSIFLGSEVLGEYLRQLSKEMIADQQEDLVGSISIHNCVFLTKSLQELPLD